MEDQVIDVNQVSRGINQIFGGYEQFIKDLMARKIEIIKEKEKITDALQKNADERARLLSKLAKLESEENLINKILSQFHGKKVDGQYVDAASGSLTNEKPQAPENPTTEKNNSMEPIVHFLEMKQEEGFVKVNNETVILDAELISETFMKKLEVNDRKLPTMDDFLNRQKQLGQLSELTKPIALEDKKHKGRKLSSEKSKKPAVGLGR